MNFWPIRRNKSPRSPPETKDASNDEAASARLAERPLLSLYQLQMLKPAFELLPYVEASRRQCMAMTDSANRLLLVVDKATAPGLLPWADAYLGRPFVLCYAAGEDISAFLSHLGNTLSAMDALPAERAVDFASSDGIESLQMETIHASASPIVRLTNSTIYDAYKVGASDIHLESSGEGLRVKYRLDGVLSLINESGSSQTAEQVISRIKVMAELDISERRVPQDGRFKVLINGREVDFRVSIMPSIHGEDAVLRILDKRALTDQLASLTLDTLGFDEPMKHLLRHRVKDPYGMVLVTGPTGSGKTTTLYAALSEVNTGQDKIITIEDPVEYQLRNVLQIPVNEKKGLSFAVGLRSILRHDPDKIMVGEIRDPETAQIAIQSALTGHLVFTTVHANNVFDVISRFAHMGVPTHSFVSAINVILAQRLVRTICPHCAVSVQPDSELLAESGLSPAMAEGFAFRHGQGCVQCRGTGYKGRKAVVELLQLTDSLREKIIAGAPLRQLREEAARDGMIELRSAALELVRRGESTLEEINRVTFIT